MTAVSFSIHPSLEHPFYVHHLAMLPVVPRVGEHVSFEARGQRYVVAHVEHGVRGAARQEVSIAKVSESILVTDEEINAEEGMVEFPEATHTAFVWLRPVSLEAERARHRERRALDRARLAAYGDASHGDQEYDMLMNDLGLSLDVEKLKEGAPS